MSYHKRAAFKRSDKYFNLCGVIIQLNVSVKLKIAFHFPIAKREQEKK